VKARTPTTLYRIGKFVRRHRLRLSIAACAIALALGAVAGVLWQARRAEIARAESEAVSRFLMGLFELTDPAHGRPGGPTVRELIERGERFADRLADQPLVQARMLDVIGRVYQRLGDFERALVLLRQSLAIRRGRLGDEHADVATSQAHLARLLHESENHDEAVEAYAIFLLRVKSDAKRAETMLRDALDRQRGSEASETSEAPRDAAGSLARAVLQRGLAAVHSGRREYQTAADLLHQTVAAQRVHLGPSHPDTIQTLSLLGRALSGAGDLASAERRVQEVLELQRQINGARHPSVILTLANLGSLARRRGDLTRAEPLYREAVSLGEEVLGADHSTVARISVGLAAVLAQNGRVPEAETLYQRILTTFRGRSDVFAHEVQDVHRRLATLYQDKGQPVLARRHTQLAQASIQ
jgi:tetratricopeptide (TPR) repeat protein